MAERTGPQRVRSALEVMQAEGRLDRLPRRLRRYCAVPDCEGGPRPGWKYCDGHSPEPEAA